MPPDRTKTGKSGKIDFDGTGRGSVKKGSR